MRSGLPAEPTSHHIPFYSPILPYFMMSSGTRMTSMTRATHLFFSGNFFCEQKKPQKKSNRVLPYGRIGKYPPVGTALPTLQASGGSDSNVFDSSPPQNKNFSARCAHRKIFRRVTRETLATRWDRQGNPADPVGSSRKSPLTGLLRSPHLNIIWGVGGDATRNHLPSGESIRIRCARPNRFVARAPLPPKWEGATPLTPLERGSRIE
jgi:hypothetical protein